MNKEQIWKVGSWLGIILVIFVAVLTIKELKSISYIGKDVSVVNTISVNGKGEEIAVPDIATFSFGVTEKAKTVADAQKSATTKLNAALKTVRDGGVEDKDIKTTSYTINPSYEYSNGVCNAVSCTPSKSILTGYEVSQTIEVKVRKIETAGTLLASIGSIEVQNVSGLSFSVDDVDGVKANARAKAIVDAKAKAVKLANDLGVSLVRITSFYDNSDQPMPYYALGGSDMMNAKVSSAPVAPQIPAGEQKVVANVTINYEIR